MNTKTLLISVPILLVVLGGLYLLITNVVQAPTGDKGPTITPVGVMYEKGNLLLGTDGPNGKSYLIGFNGHPVYTFANDTAGVSNCSGNCTATWLPYLVPDTSPLGNLKLGVNGTAGTITRADGGLQVTFNGKPLYFYISDTNTSGPTGDGVDGKWSVARPLVQTEAQADTAALNERILKNTVHITPLSVVGDSRCPTDVQCIQAGTVRISVKLEGDGETRTETMTLGSPVSFGSKHVTLMSLVPAKNSKTTINARDYRFTFSVAAGMGEATP